jgi:hypothetical protein
VLAAADPKGLDAAAQGRAAVAVLTASPANASGWMRLAYADRLKNGRLTDDGARAMEMSYVSTPYVYRQAPWRIAFALENWSNMTTEGRKEVLKEIALAHIDIGIWLELRAAVRSLPMDPSGRMTAALLGII